MFLLNNYKSHLLFNDNKSGMESFFTKELFLAFYLSELAISDHVVDCVEYDTVIVALLHFREELACHHLISDAYSLSYSLLDLLDLA